MSQFIERRSCGVEALRGCFPYLPHTFSINFAFALPQSVFPSVFIDWPTSTVHNSLQPSHPSHLCFHNQPFPASLIPAICRLCFRHTHFPAHSIHFGLPRSPLSLAFHLNNGITRTFPIPLFIFLPSAPIPKKKKIAGLRPCRPLYSLQIVLV